MTTDDAFGAAVENDRLDETEPSDAGAKAAGINSESFMVRSLGSTALLMPISFVRSTSPSHVR
jgi:hypothetical protein